MHTGVDPAKPRPSLGSFKLEVKKGNKPISAHGDFVLDCSDIVLSGQPPHPPPFKNPGSATGIGSVSSRECLDAPAILATFTAGHTGLVACL